MLSWGPNPSELDLHCLDDEQHHTKMSESSTQVAENQSRICKYRFFPSLLHHIVRLAPQPSFLTLTSHPQPSLLTLNPLPSPLSPLPSPSMNAPLPLGPEVVTIKMVKAPSKYSFYVHHYGGHGCLNTSMASVSWPGADNARMLHLADCTPYIYPYTTNILTLTPTFTLTL